MLAHVYGHVTILTPTFSKSVNLDSWTKEQVEVGIFTSSYYPLAYLLFSVKTMKQNGNIKSNAYYNPNEVGSLNFSFRFLWLKDILSVSASSTDKYDGIREGQRA